MLRARPPAAPMRGGLTPSTMRRIEEFVEAHLGDSSVVADLAALAKLSVFHFARQFKHSTGMTPHGYLVNKRLEKAKQILTATDLAIAVFAVVTGFSDQSLFTRRFGDMFGMTPAQFRKAVRWRWTRAPPPPRRRAGCPAERRPRSHCPAAQR